VKKQALSSVYVLLYIVLLDEVESDQRVTTERIKGSVLDYFDCGIDEAAAVVVSCWIDQRSTSRRCG